MHVKMSVAFFAVATLLQLTHCKPTHRYVRENDEDVESRTNKFKEFLSTIQGYVGSSGSTPQSQSSSSWETHQSHSPSTAGAYQTHQTNLTSNQIETPAGPEAADSKVHPSMVALDGSAPSHALPYYTNYNMPSKLGQYGPSSSIDEPQSIL